MHSFPFAGEVRRGRSEIESICEAEAERQRRKLIMIPSESICHPAAAATVSGELGHIYAEGLPKVILCRNPRESASDEARFASWQTRMADRRFYKGTVNANRVELIAQARIAEAFALLEGSPPAGDIYVNIQPLSGAAANLAVYDALLAPGDRLMGLDLSHGGHLTHGSRFNFSGRTYEVHSYGVQEDTRRLDYAHIRRQALESQPALIIGGASAYPWDFDWAALRGIADEVGAYLVADIAHLAGLVAAGMLMNPLPHAHVVTFTTHKTLCGPRGAVIMTAEPELAGKLDLAVFPGIQGGPHMNSIAAIGRLFELILEDYEGFRKFQREVVANTGFFGERLAEEGFVLEYGGTNTHMLLVDLKKFDVEGETFLDGEIASRLLEIGGIVCNKNVIPGDIDAAHASGLRFGLAWLTQRGVKREEISRIARIVRSVLKRVKTVAIWSPRGDKKCRGRVPAGVLEEAAEETLAIAEALPYPPKPRRRGVAGQARARLGDRVALLVRGDKVRLALGELLTARLPLSGAPIRARMLASDGSEIDDVIVAELEPRGREERWVLLPHEERAQTVRRWIENLSDGYLLFDDADLQQKVDGPNVVEELAESEIPEELARSVEGLPGEPSSDLTKPYFVGQRAIYADAKLPAKERYEYIAEEPPLRKTLLNRAHRDLGAGMAPFAGWEMPIHYGGGILAEHRAVRTAAGLFDVSHMSALELKGPHASAFLETVTANCVFRLEPGRGEYSCLLYPDGTAVDDVYVYRVERERFMVIVNAANAERVKDWLAAVNSRRYVLDEEMPAKEIDGPVEIRDLRDAGEDSVVGLALQGPASARILGELADGPDDRTAVGRLVPNALASLGLAGIRVLAARTGYTGETVGFELYVHPQDVERFWGALLKAGGPLGLLPAGLGARDSTRIEAGLPLFGHEIEGKLGLSPTEAGYGFIVRLHVPFFIGRRPYMERAARSRRRILRLAGRGRKTVRPGHVILDASGKAAGEVTSFAYVHEDMSFVALACVAEDFQPEPGETVQGARIAAGTFSGDAPERSLVDLSALSRFPEPDERDGWPTRYE